MSSITELIKELREKTGAGFLDCKKSLEDNNNDIEKSIEALRKKGLAKASKKSSREANEGAIGVYSNENMIAIIKINTETDFAAKSETFLNFLDSLGQFILDNNDLNLSKDKFFTLELNNITVADQFNSMIAKIGENLVLNELIIFDKQKSKYSYYIHNSYKKNIGKILSIISFNTNNEDENVKNFSKNLCMHIAAMKPESMDVDDLDPATKDNEAKIQKELILSSGKPSNIADKILEGKMKKYYSEVTLLNQNYILDQDKTVKDVVEEYNKTHSFELLSFDFITL